MAYWKIQLTMRGASPAGTDMKYRAVIDAPSFDAAIAGAKARFGRPGQTAASEGQAMDDAELADLDASIEGFVERGFAYRPSAIRY